MFGRRFFLAIRFCIIAGLVTLFPSLLMAQDLVELLDGGSREGTILKIRKDDKEFDFVPKDGHDSGSQVYKYSEVHTVTLKGRRFVLTPKPVQDAMTETGETNGNPSKTRKEINDLIDQAGRTPPDWYADAPLNHPASLDLSWPLKVEGPWDESKNVGQYIWGRVNPNEGRWDSGIKLIHQCMALHEGDREKLNRDMEKLGDMYFTLKQDYARAAFWLKQAKSPVSKPTGIHLAECYWRLGNKGMAIEMLRGKQLHVDAIKLFGDMGEVAEALRITQAYSRSNLFNEAFLNAGDALRNAGRLDEAIEYYQRVLDLDQARNEEYKARYKARAAGAIEAIKLFERTDVRSVADGTYRDSSTGYNGKLEVQVQVSQGRIESVRVTKHR